MQYWCYHSSFFFQYIFVFGPLEDSDIVFNEEDSLGGSRVAYEGRRATCSMLSTGYMIQKWGRGGGQAQLPQGPSILTTETLDRGWVTARVLRAACLEIQVPLTYFGVITRLLWVRTPWSLLPLAFTESVAISYASRLCSRDPSDSIVMVKWQYEAPNVQLWSHKCPDRCASSHFKYSFDSLLNDLSDDLIVWNSSAIGPRCSRSVFALFLSHETGQRIRFSSSGE